MVTLTEARYRDKVYGGWLGKLIGAAVGAQMDGQKQPQELGPSFLDSLPRAAVGTASTDFQLVWLRTLQSIGPRLTADDLASAWLRHLRYSESEYAHAVGNLRRDLRPPVCGVFDNPFRSALAALARADLWGLVAPGDPRQAAHYARQDAMLDHAGPGVEAAAVMAAMVSAAFVESEPARLIEIALSLIPDDSRVARAMRDVTRWHGELAQWPRTREMLLRSHGSEEVRDSTVAAGLIALALLHERGDFGRTLITAANCGWSTECTCAAAGAMLGVILGSSAIPARWREVVEDELGTGWGLVGLGPSLPAAVLAEQTLEVARLVIRSECGGRVQLSEEPVEEPSTLVAPDGSGLIRELAMGPYVTSFRRGPLEIQVDYDTRPTIGYELPRRLAIGVTNAGPRSLELRTRVSAPAGFVVTANSERVALPEGSTVLFMAALSAPEEYARVGAVNPCTLFVALDDGGEVTVPITLVGESLWYAAGPYASFDESHAPEQPGILSGEAPLGGEGWRRLSVAEPAVNVLAGLEGEAGTYYLATDYFLPRAQGARLRVGCNDGTKVWLHGQEVFYQHEHRPASPSSADEFEVELWEGWNRLVIKMAQCSPRRFLSVTLKGRDRHLLMEAVNTTPRRG
jgi:ADP-ribosylglycohydrolase